MFNFSLILMLTTAAVKLKQRLLLISFIAARVFVTTTLLQNIQMNVK